MSVYTYIYIYIYSLYTHHLVEDGRAVVAEHGDVPQADLAEVVRARGHLGPSQPPALQVRRAVVGGDNSGCPLPVVEDVSDLGLGLGAAPLGPTHHPLLGPPELHDGVLLAVGPDLEALGAAPQEGAPVPRVRERVAEAVDLQDIVADLVQEVPWGRPRSPAHALPCPALFPDLVRGCFENDYLRPSPHYAPHPWKMQ